MELEEDVDFSEFGPEVRRRQQVQSYILKVLVPGIDDAIKIQYYHRYVLPCSAFHLDSILGCGTLDFAIPLLRILVSLPFGAHFVLPLFLSNHGIKLTLLM
jgi:hypothetical protein